MSATHLLVTSEAMIAGQRFGIEPEAMLAIVNASSGRSGSTENKWPNYVLPGSYDSGFTAGLLLKDIRIALELANATGAPAAHAARTVELWDRAVRRLGPDADHTEIARWLYEHPEEDR
jgi:3-hydroxyisobutyrate dehydrogenase